MRVNLQGVKWTLGKGVTADDVLKQLRTHHGRIVKFNNCDRLIYVEEDDSYYYMLFLTIKDQRKVCEITTAGEITISIRELEQGKNLVDFNFVVLKKTTLRGIYQYYYHSCSLNQFCIFCMKEYNVVRDKKRKQEMRIQGGQNPSAKVAKQVNAKFKGTLEWEVMLRPETFDNLVRELSQLNEFHVTFSKSVRNK